MSEGEFSQPSPDELKKEKEELGKGFIPERWVKIKEAEKGRMQKGLEQALQERTNAMNEQELQQRRDRARRYFDELLLPPSFAGGRYAAQYWENLYELLPRVIDIKQDKNLVPDVDPRSPIHSLEKEFIIEGWLIQKVQSELKPEDALTRGHLNECFTNVSPLQLDTLINQIAQSGLTLCAASPQERVQQVGR